jgi:hypothetical protein
MHETSQSAQNYPPLFWFPLPQVLGVLLVSHQALGRGHKPAHSGGLLDAKAGKAAADDATDLVYGLV